MTDLLGRYNDDVIQAVVESALATGSALADVPLLRRALSDSTEEWPMGRATMQHLRSILVAEEGKSTVSAEGELARRYAHALAQTERYQPYVGTKDGYYVVPNKRFMAALTQRPQRFGPGARVLDLGAGTGRNGLVAALAGATVDLVEASAAGCQFAARQADELHVAGLVNVHCDDVTHWTPTGQYDAIIAITVLEHIPGSQRAELVSRIRDCLTPGGIVVATTFMGDDPGATRKESEPFSETADHVNSYLQSGELRALFDGFSMIEYFEHRKLDTSHGQPHYHSIAEMIGCKDEGEL